MTDLPHTSRTKDWLYWRCPAKYRKLGYKPTSVRLPGRVGDDRSEERAQEAHRLTNDMIAFADSQRDALTPNTWAWLISRYRKDGFSPYHEVKANTREVYDHLLTRWTDAIGHMEIADLDFAAIKTIERDMRDEGRSVDSVSRMFTMIRTVARYGSVLAVPGARDIRDILHDIRVQSPVKRQVCPTREQVRAVIDEADARGLHSFAAGLLLQWTYMLRAVDVRGQWLADDGQGGLVRNGTRWQDGLTWNMIDLGLTRIRKVISKTARSMPEPMTFELTPELRTRLRMLGSENRIGPVIVSERTGLPYTRRNWSGRFNAIRDALDLPDEIRAMDIRAGAVSEAQAMGADAVSIRDAAGHANVATTDRYMRGRQDNVAKVVNLRARLTTP